MVSKIDCQSYAFGASERNPLFVSTSIKNRSHSQPHFSHSLSPSTFSRNTFLTQEKKREILSAIRISLSCDIYFIKYFCSSELSELKACKEKKMIAYRLMLKIIKNKALEKRANGKKNCDINHLDTLFDVQMILSRISTRFGEIEE